MKKTGLKRQQGDQFYTKKSVVDSCMKHVRSCIDLNATLVIEPSAGDGAFCDAIKQSTQHYEFYDIDPKHDDITKCDFLALDIPEQSLPICFLGNPPFGRQSSLAIKFIKKSCAIAKFVCFILPNSFKKESMQRHFPPRFHLVHQSEIAENGFIVDGSSHNVPCVFQIWERRDTERTTLAKQKPVGFAFVKKNENHDIAFRRVGVNAGTLYRETQERSEQSHYFIKFDSKLDCDSCVDLLQNIEYPSSNTVGPRSISKQELTIKFNEKLTFIV